MAESLKATPPSISDSDISSAQSAGVKRRDSQLSGRSRFNPLANIAASPSLRRDLLGSLMGFSAGSQAALEASKLGDPFVSGLAGAAGVAGAQPKIQEFNLEMSPVDEISPGLVERFPELSGVPLAYVSKLSPLLKKQDDLEKQLVLISARGEQARQNIGISGEEQRKTAAIRGEEARRTVGARTAIRPLSAELIKLKNNAVEGAGSLDAALAMFDELDTATIQKAALGGLKGQVARVGDEKAQELNRLVSTAQDVITRLRTGAALNASEEKYYQRLLLDFFASRGQNKAALTQIRDFFRRISSDVDAGRQVSATGIRGVDDVSDAGAGLPVGAIERAKAELARRRSGR